MNWQKHLLSPESRPEMIVDLAGQQAGDPWGSVDSQVWDFKCEFTLSGVHSSLPLLCAHFMYHGSQQSVTLCWTPEYKCATKFKKTLHKSFSFRRHFLSQGFAAAPALSFVYHGETLSLPYCYQKRLFRAKQSNFAPFLWSQTGSIVYCTKSKLKNYLRKGSRSNEKNHFKTLLKTIQTVSCPSM